MVLLLRLTTAATNATTAISTANSATTTANNAVTTANSAVTTANTANTTAGSAVTTANSATSTANTANTNATAAVNTANAASAAVSNAVLFTLVANVAAIPGSPSNNDYIEIGNSTGIESFSPLSGLPSGFVGASGLTVRLRYDSSASSWVFMSYFANDSEDRYLTKNIPVVTGDSTNGSGQITLNCENNSHGIKIKGPPHSAAATYTLTLPNDAGSNGQSLTTNGSGTLTWATPATGSTDSISEGNTSAEVIDTGTDGRFVVTTEGSERLRIDSSGNVGIGTTNPLAKLHVESAATTAGWQLRTDSVGLNNESGFYRDASDNYELVIRNGLGGLSFIKNDGGTSTANLAFNVQGSERMRIDSSGKVGIGTSSPATTFVVEKSDSSGLNAHILVNNSQSGSGISLIGAGTSFSSGGWPALTDAGIIRSSAGSSNGLALSAASGPLSFWTGSSPSERLRVDSSGRLLVGRTASVLDNIGGIGYANIVQIEGAATGSGLAVSNTAGTGRININRKYSPSNGDDLGYLSFGAEVGGTVERARITCAAEFTNANTRGGRLVFATCADGAHDPTERLRITSSGNAIFAADASINGLTIGRGAGNSANNTAVGDNVLQSNTSGVINTGLGGNALLSLTGGNRNTALGYNALRSCTTATNNTAVGVDALYAATTGAQQGNTAVGDQSGRYLTTGSRNVAVGYFALFSSTTSSNNTALGGSALYSNTTGANNVATGYAPLHNNTTGFSNVATGYQALFSNTTGYQNVAIGESSLRLNTTGSDNVSVGRWSMYANTTGSENAALGIKSLHQNTTGTRNTAAGAWALYTNSTGVQNTATGYQALYSNTTGGYNTASGFQALKSNTTGGDNCAYGYYALFANTTGGNNAAFGMGALDANTTGADNVAVGSISLTTNTTGRANLALGRSALYSNTTGQENISVGAYSLYANTTARDNTAVGYAALDANTTGASNVAIGHRSCSNITTGSGNIGIGFKNSSGSYAPVFNPTTENNRFVAGHTSITNAYVKVSWTVTSDERDKMNFAPVPYGLDFVNQLKPTAYQFKVDRDTETPNGDVRYGFKAQDILALEGDNPVIIDNEDADHLKYKGEHLVPVLVNAVQELTAMVKELQAEIKTLKG